jgi:ribose-phosphate pyrophosphokinase
VIGVQAALAENQALLAQLQGEQLEPLQILDASTEQLPNDNTYVKLYGGGAGVQVVNRSVYIVLPRVLSDNALMEALIKIRAAHTMGATTVTVVSAILLKDIQFTNVFLKEVMSLENLVVTAGGRWIREADIHRSAQATQVVAQSAVQPGFVLGGSNHPELLGRLAKKLGVPSYSFADLRAQPAAFLKGRKIYWLAASTSPVNEHFFTTLAQIHWFKTQGAVVHFVSPYLPYARSDKPEFAAGVTTQGRLIADLIESVGTDGITVVRAHAPQSLGFFKIHAVEVPGRETIMRELSTLGIDALIAPDAGAQKSVTQDQHELNKMGPTKRIGLVVMNKERISASKEQIVGGTGLEMLEGMSAAIVDDETATGGTLDKVAKFIQAQSKKPKETIAVVTHLAGNAASVLSSKDVSQLICTDTVPIQVAHAKIRVVSIADELGDSILQMERNR